MICFMLISLVAIRTVDHDGAHPRTFIALEVMVVL